MPMQVYSCMSCTVYGDAPVDLGSRPVSFSAPIYPSKAVLMGLAAHRSIDTGRPVLWSEMLDEFEAARAQYGEQQ